MNPRERFKYLLSKYLDGRLSGAEQKDFFDLLATGNYDDILEAQVADDIENQELKLSASLPAHISNEIISNILIDSAVKLNSAYEKKRDYKIFRYTILAAFLILAFSVLRYRAFFRSDKFLEDFVAKNPDKILNTGKRPLCVVLPDGSQITLQAESALYFAKNSFLSNRNVYLQGEAFFNVTKNPLKPFCVYYDKLVAKVLGTSFKISTNKTTGNIEVEVLTGRVKVCENEKIINNPKTSISLTVIPNQKAVYKIGKHTLEAKLADHPSPIADNENQKSGTNIKPVIFVFQNEKLSEVIKNLKKNYGIEMEVTNDAINNCVFSGDITKEDLYNKLNVLCTATNATYEITGAKILISGAGCN